MAKQHDDETVEALAAADAARAEAADPDTLTVKYLGHEFTVPVYEDWTDAQLDAVSANDSVAIARTLLGPRQLQQLRDAGAAAGVKPRENHRAWCVALSEALGAGN